MADAAYTTEENAPAMPGSSYGIGLTAREHAAIQLRLPESGTPWLDEMIAKARKLDTITALTAQQCSADGAEDVANEILDSVLFEPRLVGGDPAAEATQRVHEAAVAGPKAGDIVIVKDHDCELYRHGLRARLVEKEGAQWIACFAGLGNPPGSWAQCVDDSWYITDFTLERRA